MQQKTQLSNGLTVVSERVPELRSCSLGIWCGAGSRFETEKQAGLSHFLEHMFFKGTQSRTAYDIAVSMDSVGGQLNAFTDREHTCYYARVMDRHLPLAIDILSDMVNHSLFDAAEIEREKGVVLEEIKMYEDTPDDQVFELFNRSFYRSHPLGRPVIGYAPMVRGLTRQDLVEYVERRYHPGNLLIACAGQVDHDELLALLEKHFQGTQNGQKPLPTSPPPTTTQHRSVYNKSCEQTYLCLGAPGISYVDPRRYTMLVLDSVLGGCMSSRLFQEIREKRGLVYSVSTIQTALSDCGTFGIFAGTSAEKVPEVLTVARGIFSDVAGNGITDEELVRAKELLKGALALNLESTSSRMMRIARNNLYYGRFVPIEETIQKIDDVSPSQVKELASWLLDPDRYSLAALGPVTEVDGIAAQPLPESLALSI
ncbi:insulinase family protein [bacterium]|nr:insulinase family protein [bacterium]